MITTICDQTEIIVGVVHIASVARTVTIFASQIVTTTYPVSRGHVDVVAFGAL